MNRNGPLVATSQMPVPDCRFRPACSSDQEISFFPAERNPTVRPIGPHYPTNRLTHSYQESAEKSTLMLPAAYPFKSRRVTLLKKTGPCQGLAGGSPRKRPGWDLFTGITSASWPPEASGLLRGRVPSPHNDPPTGALRSDLSARPSPKEPLPPVTEWRPCRRKHSILAGTRGGSGRWSPTERNRIPEQRLCGATSRP
jgi:hypothetical protein